MNQLVGVGDAAPLPPTHTSTLTSGSSGNAGGVGGDNNRRGGDRAVGDVNFNLVTSICIQATHVETRPL